MRICGGLTLEISRMAVYNSSVDLGKTAVRESTGLESSEPARRKGDVKMADRNPSVEDILRGIAQQGMENFTDEKRLLSLFADFSRGQLRAQQNRLEIFCRCGGPAQVCRLRGAAPVDQQTGYSRLIQKMENSYGMSRDAAEEICGAYWRVAMGAAQPRMATAASAPSLSAQQAWAQPQPAQKPAPMPQPTPTEEQCPPDFQEQSSPTQQTPPQPQREALSRKKIKAAWQRFSSMATGDRWALVLGWIGVVFGLAAGIAILCSVAVNGVPQGSTYSAAAAYGVALFYLAFAAGVGVSLVGLWRRGETQELHRSTVNLILNSLYVIALIFIAPFAIMLTTHFMDRQRVFSQLAPIASIFLWLYCFIRQRRRIRKIKP